MRAVALSIAILMAALMQLPEGRAADEVDTGWVELKRDEIADWLFDRDGVRVSNCHVKKHFGDLAGGSIVPSCYVFNHSWKPINVTIQFIGLSDGPDPALSITLSTLTPLSDYTGAELTQFIPFSREDLKKVISYRLRAKAIFK